MVIRYGAYFLAVTGVVILLGNLMYDKFHYGPALVIPFAGGNLSFAYGWCFWMSLAIGKSKFPFFQRDSSFVNFLSE